MPLKKNSVTVFPALSAPSVKDFTSADVFPFFLGLPFNITIFLPIPVLLFYSDLISQRRSLSASVCLVDISCIQDAGNQYLTDHLPFI